MAKLFPGILAAALLSVPGWLIAAFVVSPKLLARPVEENVAMFFHGAPIFLALFGAITLTYGAAAWWVLRVAGLLNLGTLLSASLLPVAAYIVVSIWLHGYDSGWPGAALAFGIPALFIGVGLWLFTVRIPL